MAYYAYLLECADGTYYTGSTDNLFMRVAQHNEGRGARYTKVRLPAKLVYFEEFSDRSQAAKREREIKKMSKQEKKKLVEESRKKKNPPKSKVERNFEIGVNLGIVNLKWGAKEKK